MKSPRTMIRAWRSRRKLRTLEEWERIRVKGRGRYIVRVALYYGFAIVGVVDFYDQILRGKPSSVSLGNLLWFVFLGLVFA